jgi:hypothetical protein
MSVYKAINAVQAALCKEGIAKDSKNVQQGYNFRGIDAVYNALAPLLSANGLCILPRCVERDCVERTTAKGNALFYVTVKCEFDFVAAEDGSKHTVTMYGEAMDSGDKATNKAMSAAYKYACMQAFSIPTEGDNDADAATHEVVATPVGRPQDGMMMQDFSPDRQIEIASWVGEIKNKFAAGDVAGAAESWGQCDLPKEEKSAVWFDLNSHTRTSLKKFLGK